MASNQTFSDIYRAHIRFVWRSLRACGIPEHAVQDAAQEVFLVAHRRLSDYDGASNMRTWLYGIARRVAANRRRAALRTEKREAKAAGPGRDDNDPESALAARQDLARVQAFLDQLEPASRDVFFLFHLESFSSREIGEMLDLNIHTVNTRLRAIRKRFRIYWGGNASDVTEKAVSSSG